MTSLAGQSIGHYQILDLIGQTPLTFVYRALDKTDQCEVAVKVINNQAFSSQHFEEILGRYRKSTQALTRLSHPHIVRLRYSGISKKFPYLAMDYFAGGSLKARSGTPKTWHEAARLLAPVARALEYAHASKVIHGDIKLDNILIGEGGIPMLSDFGMTRLLAAKNASALESINMGIGTPDYMAPEQLSAQAQPQTDIYSLGIVFFELVTATVPFHANTPAIGLLKHVDDPLPDPRELNSDLTDEVAGILKTALAKLPSQRYATMGEFATVLEKLAQSAPPPPPIHLPQAIKTRLTGRSAWLILVTLITLAAVLYLASQIRLPPAVGRQSPSPSASIAVSSTPMTTNTPVMDGDEVVMPSIPNTRVTYNQDFDMPTISDWKMKLNSAILDGSLRIVGQGNWQDLSQAIRLTSLYEGDAALVLFRYRPGASFNLFLHSSEGIDGGTNTALEWGISVFPGGELETHVYQGDGNTSAARWEGSLVPQPDQVYPLLLRVGGRGEFTARLWDIKNPDLYLEMVRLMPPAWSGLSWNFTARAYNGMLNLDKYQELHFD